MSQHVRNLDNQVLHFVQDDNICKNGSGTRTHLICALAFSALRVYEMNTSLLSH